MLVVSTHPASYVNQCLSSGSQAPGFPLAMALRGKKDTALFSPIVTEYEMKSILFSSWCFFSCPFFVCLMVWPLLTQNSFPCFSLWTAALVSVNKGCIIRISCLWAAIRESSPSLVIKSVKIMRIPLGLIHSRLVHHKAACVLITVLWDFFVFFKQVKLRGYWCALRGIRSVVCIEGCSSWVSFFFFFLLN